MPRFAANLSFLYAESPFLERFKAAAADGFLAVEYLFPYAFGAHEIKSRLQAGALEQVLFNAPPGDWEKGERGIASLPGREEEFRVGMLKALEYASVLGNKRLHIMAGVIKAEENRERHREVYLKNLAWAADLAASEGITILIEPINQRDMPGYFLSHQNEAHEIRREIGASNLRVQFDFYHAQIVEGDLSVKLRAEIRGIAHVQAASVPDRHEPEDGELNYSYLFKLLDELGYAGWVGCEYKPRGLTSAGLAWLRPWQ